MVAGTSLSSQLSAYSSQPDVDVGASGAES
jgi:hypothetical protein